jgi:streptomycin 6-kinase
MNSSGIDRSARERFEICARRWHVTIDRSLDTDTSLIGFGLTGSQAVVMKVEKQTVDDASAASVLAAFQGDGVVRLLEQADGVLLMERIVPGEPLAGLTLSGRDDEAIGIIADLVARTSDRTAPEGCPTIQAWSLSFDRHSRSGDARIPGDLVDHARELYGDLARSQRTPHLLHGDLHHDNVLYDATRGWLAIDPKGVVGETEYELGAALRNPIERPDLFADEAIVERRLARVAAMLGIDADRALAWAFAQAVLSAIWSIEDGCPPGAERAVLRLAETIRAMLPR